MYAIYLPDMGPPHQVRIKPTTLIGFRDKLTNYDGMELREMTALIMYLSLDQIKSKNEKR